MGARAVKCDRDPEEGGIQAELYLRAHEWKMHIRVLPLKSQWEEGTQKKYYILKEIRKVRGLQQRT